jgi:transcriptional regulator with XRE-family HTH domain
MVMAVLKAHYLLKQNVDALLKARGQSRKELAFFCRRSEAWISQIFTKQDRNIPLKYLDRIADFFGLATYQLFQPGISPLTERRSGHERRSGRDRRLSRAAEVLQPTPSLADLALQLRSLSPDEYRRWVVRAFGALASLERAPADISQLGKPDLGGTQSSREDRNRGRRRRANEP